MRYKWRRAAPPDGWYLTDTQAIVTPNRIWMVPDHTWFRCWVKTDGYSHWSPPIPIPEGLKEDEAKAYARAVWQLNWKEPDQ